MFPALLASVSILSLPPNRFPSFTGPRMPRSRACLSLPTARAQASSRRTRRPQNVDGEFFVDTVCIDCDTCRWMAPDIFTRVANLSAVAKQPQSKAERLNALQALLACPTSSIHTEKPPADILEAQDTFPLPIEEEKLPGVYHCGYHSEKSYGAASYLLVHPDGNVLIDGPRYTERLARKIDLLGGVRFMFLTHKDDIADHEKWSKRLKCDRILHAEDVEASTVDVEIKLDGSGPWNLNESLKLIHTPGHTKGSVCLFYRPLQVLFTGDHLAMTATGLSIYEQYNRDSVLLQIDSVKTLARLDFKWILPGHGRRVEYENTAEKTAALEAFVEQKLAPHSGF
ncbi:hypothetical protein MLD38_011321 [Melastoma candidum]|uniref:Uncharacterized protein n=1 Tax=Melastoma candidum TaxID=119954 RepID=A0ACB9R3T1_9MYRT|nr:hypothetical protein MLD38_011321 [Melastoma candidum]